MGVECLQVSFHGLVECVQRALKAPKQHVLICTRQTRRADTAGTWYLKGFLQNLIEQVKDIPLWQQAGEAEVLAFVYQISGAINYYGISEPTLTGIFGRDFYGELNANYPDQLVHLIDAGLAAGPPR